VSADEDPNDPGLARERTALAWNRSGLAIIVCIAVVLRHLWPLRGTDESVALGIIAAAAIIWALALLSLHVTRRDRRNGFARGDRTFGLITVGTVVLAIGGIALTLLTPA
jgi:uncharacterized membrane protein YidH (DUF202 family)